MDLSEIRARLAVERGPRFWRSLEELAGTEAFQEYLGREFPSEASEWTDPSSRRTFLRLMGASLALAGVTGCGINKPEKIVPYVRAPEEIVPGKPLFFATALTLEGYALGVLVESHMGRPTKIEGNVDHPASLGSTDAVTQASILTMYDPDRSQTVAHNGRVSTWSDFLAVAARVRREKLERKGAGLRILARTTTSPTLIGLYRSLLRDMPQARFHLDEPVGRENAKAGAKLAFGRDVCVRKHVDRADVILSLDDDFLACGPARVADARAFAARREPESGSKTPNRLYVAEATVTVTGAMADHRLPIPAGRIPAVAQAIARAVGVDVPAPAEEVVREHAEWIRAVADDLKAARERALVTAGATQPPEVHALAHAMNAALASAGRTVEYLEPIEYVENVGTLAELATDMEAGKVDTLVILSANPVYDAPADLDFARRMAEKVKLRIHLGLYEDETAALANWHVPEAHELEMWGDARAFDGTATIQQPLIAPLYSGRSAIEVVAALAGRSDRVPLDLVRDQWLEHKRDGDFESFWKRSVHDGFVANSAAEPVSVTVKGGPFVPKTRPVSGLEIVFRADPSIYDGRYANNGWLQELPKPISKLTWDNAALVSPRTAESLNVKSEDLVELTVGERKLDVPVWVTPMHADDSVTLYLGYGRKNGGRVAEGAGFDANALRTTGAPWLAGVGLRKLDRKYELATTQHHQTMEGRELIRVASFARYKAEPKFAQEPEAHLDRGLTLYEDPQFSRGHEPHQYAWAMVINLNTCIGCNACAVACQAENNIPVVGKDQVRRGRHMNWIRIDRYFEGDPDRPNAYFQPLPCMHCEKAPCELVCPVAATTHSAEGLNEMTYNRCVGTRYCSNNCPYKVRRFNFLQYQDESTPSFKLMRNPDVTIRARGVMEKCTYCVQRINSGRMQAEMENRRIRDGEVITACAQACPTRAITFGDMNDETAGVAKLRKSDRHYGLLEELNTRPRTTYLAKLTNPNPALPSELPASNEPKHAKEG